MTEPSPRPRQVTLVGWLTMVGSVAVVALLVDRARSQELEDHLEYLAEQAHGRMQLTLLGPLAPYDFVGGR